MPKPTGAGRIRLGLISAGLIGERHAQLIAAEPDLDLAPLRSPSGQGICVASRQSARGSLGPKAAEKC